MRRYIVALMVLLSAPAFAEDVKPAPQQVDPNTSITITVGELQALLQAEHDKIATEAVAAKIQAQIKAKK
jgi:hypothetical protein